MLAALIPIIAGAMGGGGGGGGGAAKQPTSNRQSQDGNTLNSGTGSFTVGGLPPWVMITGLVLLGVGLLAGIVWLFTRKP